MKLNKTAENIFFLEPKTHEEQTFIEEAKEQSYDLLKNGMCFNEIAKDIMSLAATKQEMSMYLRDTLLDKIELMFFYWKMKKKQLEINASNYVLFQYRNTIQKKYVPAHMDLVQWYLIPIFEFGGDKLHESLEKYAAYSRYYPFNDLDINDRQKGELKWECDNILFGVACEDAGRIVNKSREHVGLLLPYQLKKNTGTITENYYEVIITE